MSIPAKPGEAAKLIYRLNQSDAISITVDWSTWLGSDTISSASWTAETGLTVSGESNTTTAATALVTAGSTNGRLRVENQITTAGAQKRSVAIDVQVVDLLP